MNAAAHTVVNAMKASVLNWDIVHVQKDTSELLLKLMLAVQLSDVFHQHQPQHHQLLTQVLQLLMSTPLLLVQHQKNTHVHQPTIHVTIARVMNDFMAIAGHQRPAHTANVTPTDKFDVLRPNVPRKTHARRVKRRSSKLPLMDVAMLSSAEISRYATRSSAHSRHQLVSTMKTASVNQLMNVVVHTLVYATRTSAAILVRLNVQKDTHKPLLLHMNVAQFPSAASSQLLLQSTQPPPPPQLPLLHQHILHQQLLQLLSPISSHKNQFVSITREHHDAMVKSGKLILANDVAVLLQVS